MLTLLGRKSLLLLQLFFTVTNPLTIPVYGIYLVVQHLPYEIGDYAIMLNDGIRDYSIKKMKGKKDHAAPLEIGQTGHGKKNQVPPILDHIIDPLSTDQAIDQKEMLIDFIECLKPRLKPFELDVFTHYFQCGYTQEETATLLLVTRPYVTQTLKRIESKIERLRKTYKL